MSPFFGFLVALFATMLLIPPLLKLAGPLGLLDKPNGRKVHQRLVPCCGGLAIIAGAAVPVFLWLPLDRMTWSIFAGALVVAFFGLWDDRRELSAKWKLLGQLIGIAIAVQGGVVMERLPFFGLDPVSPFIAYAITTLFLLGVTNAINLSDGLDGLAAGCTLLTLGIVALFAYLAEGYGLALIALAVMGSILGFLRYNTYPAVVFLGDAGSQFLGFFAGCLTILLCGQTNPALAPALPLLLFGLPLIDTFAVILQRIRDGRSPFKPDRGHIHHKLLALGLAHHEAVSLIYLVQAILVCTAFMLRYQSDLLVVAVFAAFGALVMGFFAWARRARFRVRPGEIQMQSVERREFWIWRLRWLPWACTRYMASAIAVFLIGGALSAPEVTVDFAAVSLPLTGVAVCLAALVPHMRKAAARLVTYVAAVMIAYLVVDSSALSWAMQYAAAFCIASVALVLVVAIRITRRDRFRMTPQDLLILFFGLVAPGLVPDLLSELPLGRISFHLVVLFYAAEFLFTAGPVRYGDRVSGRLVAVASSLALCILGIRGVIAG